LVNDFVTAAKLRNVATKALWEKAEQVLLQLVPASSTKHANGRVLNDPR